MDGMEGGSYRERACYLDRVTKEAEVLKSRFKSLSATRSLVIAMVLAFSLTIFTFSIVLGQAASGSAGSTGGTVEFAGGDVTVKLSSGAVKETVSVDYTPLDSATAPAPAPAGVVFGSQIFQLGVSVDSVVKDAYAFGRLVDVTVKYSADDLAQAYGGRRDHVSLYIYDSAFGVWNEDTAAIRDVVGDSLTSRQSVLGTYALMVDPSAAQAPATGDLGLSSNMALIAGVLALMSMVSGAYLLQTRRSRAF